MPDQLSSQEIDRVIEMAWEDRTTFEAIEFQFGLSEAEVIAWCHETMAAYKCPRQVVFVDALPKTGSGKVQWRELAEAEAAAQNDTKTGT